MGRPQLQRVHHQPLKPDAHFRRSAPRPGTPGFDSPLPTPSSPIHLQPFPEEPRHVRHQPFHRRDEPPTLHEPCGRRRGPRRPRDGVHQLNPRQRRRSEAAAQGGHPPLDGRRPEHHGYLGSETGGGDRRPVQADFHECRWDPDLRTHADDGAADAPHVARPIDEHAGSGPHARPLLHAHRLRAESQCRAPELRRRDRPRTGRSGPRSGDPPVRFGR